MRHVTHLLLGLGLLSLGACEGKLGYKQFEQTAQQEPEAQLKPAEPSKPAEPIKPVEPDDPVVEQEMFRDVMFSTSAGVRRLTRHEYRRTIESLTGVELDSADVPVEIAVEGHTQIASAQKTGYDDVTRYLDTGIVIAEQVATSSFVEQGCEDTDQACTTQWGQRWIRRVFRGVLDEETRTRYLAMLDSPDAGDTPAERRVTFLATLLSSPQFLYRRERGEAIDSETRRTLTSMEIASRMSYLLWQSEPDEVLLDAAESGDLRNEQDRLAQVERMLDDPRAKYGLQAFVKDWMALRDEAVVGSKDASVLEGTSEDLPHKINTSLTHTIDDHFERPDSRIAGLLSIESFVVDAEVASVLDLDEIQGDGYEPRTLDLTYQRGILTHPAVLAAHTKESGASPFPIGAFVYSNILCDVIPPPPEIPEFDEKDELEADLTLRQRLEHLVKGPTCMGCHTLINAPGFAFLPFDPIGRYEPADSRGRLHDTSGRMIVGQDMLDFSNISQLTHQLATHPSTAECVADRLFRWTYGRFERSGDEQELEELRQIAINSKTDARVLLRALITSDAFIHVRHTAPKEPTP